VKRWKSPQIASKRAERAAKEAAKKRREKRTGWLIVACWAVVSLGLCVADYLWMKARAERRREEHQRIYHRQAQTNSPASPVGSGGQTNTTEPP
jgi:uncharacterized protein HemX